MRSAWGVRWVPQGGTSLGSWVLGGTTRQAAVLAKSSNYYRVPRGAFFCAARRRAITALRGPGRILAAAESGGASLDQTGQCERGSFRSLVAPHDTLCGRCCACSTWAWARGGPASLGRRCTHARARRRGWGRLTSWSSLLRVFDSPMVREMSLLHGDRALLCFGATRRPWRSAWRSGMVVSGSGAGGVVSSPLRGTAFRCALYAFCPFA